MCGISLYKTKWRECSSAARGLIKLRRNRTRAAQSSTSVRTAFCKGKPIPSAVTKAAIVHLTKCRARIFAPKVRVNAVAPGVIENTRWNADNPNFNMQTYQAGANNVPLKRLGEPEDIAEAVYYLASENASYITGPILPVEGGMCVQA